MRVRPSWRSAIYLLFHTMWNISAFHLCRPHLKKVPPGRPLYCPSLLFPHYNETGKTQGFCWGKINSQWERAGGAGRPDYACHTWWMLPFLMGRDHLGQPYQPHAIPPTPCTGPRIGRHRYNIQDVGFIPIKYWYVFTWGKECVCEIWWIIWGIQNL